MADDLTLLREYANRRDGTVFLELVQRHSALVYSACLRVTGNAHDAEDVAQECFLELARKAHEVETSLGGWLHALATRRSINHVRNAATRRRHEHAATPRPESTEPAWSEIAPHVDEALAELPEDTRQVLILHFLEGRPQTEVAEQLGIAQSTVARRVEKGTTTLREGLRKKGILASAALLSGLLGENASAAVPPTLTVELGKMALAGVGKGTAAGAIGGSAAIAGTKLTIAAVVVALALATSGILLYQHTQNPAAAPITTANESHQSDAGGNQPVGDPSTVPVGNLDVRYAFDATTIPQNPPDAESFVAILQAAGLRHGRPLDAETIYGYSLNGFVPSVVTWENEAARMTWFAKGDALELVAERMGLQLRKIGSPSTVTGMAAWCEQIRRELADGRMVIVDGWLPFRPGEWGIVTEVTADNRIRAASTNGQADNPVDDVYHAWAVVGTSEPNSTPALDREMLRQAILGMRGARSDDPQAVFGVKAVDLLIAQFSHVPFCPNCPPKVCATPCMAPLLRGFRKAETFLGERNGIFPPAARPHLAEASAHLQTIVALLSPAFSGTGGPAFKDFLEDTVGQENYVKTVLKPAREELLKTADALERALERSVSKPTQEGNRTWIADVPVHPTGYQWDAGLRCLQIVLEHRGHAVSLEELMAWSGDAFNLCHGSNWQGVSYLCIPTDPTRNVLERYGIAVECLHDGYGHEKMNALTVADRRIETGKILNRIHQAIVAGHPAIVLGCTNHCGDWTVVNGYDTQANQLLHIGTGQDGTPAWIGVRGFPGNPVYDDDREGGVDGLWNGRFRGTIRPNFVGGWQNNPVFILGESGQPVAPREAAISALERAITIARAPRHHLTQWGGVDYCFGTEAYDEWAKALRTLDYPADLKKELPKDAYDWYEMGNMDTQVDQIVRGREAAAVFCERAATLWPEAAPLLNGAAEAFRDEVKIAQETFAPFIPAFNGQDKPRVAWLSSPERREAGAQAIERMKQCDLKATSQIQKALNRVNGDRDAF